MGAFYLQFWPSFAAAACLAVFSAWGASAQPRYWVLLAGFLIIVALALYVPSLLGRAAEPRNNILGRDIVASVALAAAAPAWAAWAAFALHSQGFGPIRRAVTSLAMSLLLLAASPIIVLLVHCTSGDCL
jgi:hypothetical protein